MVKEDLFEFVKSLVHEIFYYEDNKSLKYTNDEITLELCNDEIKIGIYDDCIYLYLFSKCISSDKKGKDYLRDIIRFSEELHKIIRSIQCIKLQDKSTIIINDCVIDFMSYRIITKGNTWYNEFGFFSKHHGSDIQFFKMIQSSNLNQLKMIYKDIFEYEKYKDNKTIIELKKYYSKYAKIPLKKLIPLLEKELNKTYVRYDYDYICLFLSDILGEVSNIYYFIHVEKNNGDGYFYYDLSKHDTTGGKRKTKRKKRNPYKSVKIKRSVKIYKRRRAEQPT